MSIGIFKGNIPHLLFYGNIENNNIKEEILKITKNEYILVFNCAINKGIKNIREEIVSFVKFQLPVNIKFKCVLLYDAEYLTIDSQYLLRRIIEIYSHNTRFIIITRDKDKLLKPIISRFIHIYKEENEYINGIIPYNKIKNILTNNLDIIDCVNELYIQGIYADILLQYLKNKVINFIELEFYYDRFKNILKNEKFIMLHLIYSFRNNKKIEI